MSWACPHCEKDLDPEVLKYGVVIGKAEAADSVFHDAICSSCSRPIRIQFIAHTTYKPCAVDKRAQLTLVTDQET